MEATTTGTRLRFLDEVLMMWNASWFILVGGGGEHFSFLVQRNNSEQCDLSLPGLYEKKPCGLLQYDLIVKKDRFNFCRCAIDRVNPPIRTVPIFGIYNSRGIELRVGHHEVVVMLRIDVAPIDRNVLITIHTKMLVVQTQRV